MPLTLRNALILTLTGAAAFVAGCGASVTLVKETAPLMSHVHYGHALTGWFDTPGKQGLFVTAEGLATEIEETARTLENRILEGRMGGQLALVDRLRTLIGTTTEITGGRSGSGAPYTLISSLYHANEHMRFAASSGDASINMTGAASEFSSNVEGVYSRAATMLDILGVFESAAGAEQARTARALRLVARQILEGEDINADRIIGNASGEHGLRQLRDTLAATAAAEKPAYQPVPARFLFGVVRLPDGRWKFRDSGSTGTYRRTY